jgi:hypothetical protein
VGLRAGPDGAEILDSQEREDYGKVNVSKTRYLTVTYLAGTEMVKVFEATNS